MYLTGLLKFNQTLREGSATRRGTFHSFFFHGVARRTRRDFRAILAVYRVAEKGTEGWVISVLPLSGISPFISHLLCLI